MPLRRSRRLSLPSTSRPKGVVSAVPPSIPTTLTAVMSLYRNPTSPPLHPPHLTPHLTPSQIPDIDDYDDDDDDDDLPQPRTQPESTFRLSRHVVSRHAPLPISTTRRPHTAPPSTAQTPPSTIHPPTHFQPSVTVISTFRASCLRKSRAPGINVGELTLTDQAVCFDAHYLSSVPADAHVVLPLCDITQLRRLNYRRLLPHAVLVRTRRKPDFLFGLSSRREQLAVLHALELAADEATAGGVVMDGNVNIHTNGISAITMSNVNGASINGRTNAGSSSSGGSGRGTGTGIGTSTDRGRTIVYGGSGGISDSFGGRVTIPNDGDDIDLEEMEDDNFDHVATPQPHSRPLSVAVPSARRAALRSMITRSGRNCSVMNGMIGTNGTRLSSSESQPSDTTPSDGREPTPYRRPVSDSAPEACRKPSTTMNGRARVRTSGTLSDVSKSAGGVGVGSSGIGLDDMDDWTKGRTKSRQRRRPPSTARPTGAVTDARAKNLGDGKTKIKDALMLPVAEPKQQPSQEYKPLRSSIDKGEVTEALTQSVKSCGSFVINLDTPLLREHIASERSLEALLFMVTVTLILFVVIGIFMSINHLRFRLLLLNTILTAQK